MDKIPEDWLALKSLCYGDTCVIIGNGPSLKKVPLEFLKKYDTFGSNRIYLLHDFAPTFYACVNPLVISQCINEIDQDVICSAKFIAEDYAPSVPGSFSLHSRPVPSFSLDPWNGIYEGYTVTFVSMQIAFFLGYTNVLLVGVDHRYDAKGPANAQVVSEADDPNHFDPAYFAKGFTWNLPDLAMSELAYKMAKTVFESHGRKIINLTERSALEVFETGKVEDW